MAGSQNRFGLCGEEKSYRLMLETVPRPVQPIASTCIARAIPVSNHSLSDFNFCPFPVRAAQRGDHVCLAECSIPKFQWCWMNSGTHMCVCSHRHKQLRHKTTRMLRFLHGYIVSFIQDDYPGRRMEQIIVELTEKSLSQIKRRNNQPTKYSELTGLNTEKNRSLHSKHYWSNSSFDINLSGFQVEATAADIKCRAFLTLQCTIKMVRAKYLNSTAAHIHEK